MACLPSIAIGKLNGPALDNFDTTIRAVQQIHSKRLRAGVSGFGGMAW
jgi:hypothetical protein